ncbi:MAG TPA: CARDB domain-containing protein [Kofleriaceae bacterium]|jgi:subtilase family serine protease
MSVERVFNGLFVASVVLVGGCGVGSDDPSVDTVFHGPAAGPDLIESAVGDPPASSQIGGTFTVSDTVTNQGTATAGATFTKYYLSANGSSASPYLLGNRSVGSLGAGAAAAGSTTATVPTSVPSGSYHIVACADSSGGQGGRISEVDETDEQNNCTASSGSITIAGANLVEGSVTVSPTTIDPLVGTLTVSDTVTNNGTGDAGGSITRWYLSADTEFVPGQDPYIRNCTDGGPVPGRTIPALSAGASNSGASSTSPFCIRDASGLHAPADGTYYILVCADNTNQIGETDENDNCTASANQVTVGAVSTDVDLVETAVSDPPAAGVIGDTFPIDDTAQNIGGDMVGSSFSKFYLSSDGTTLNTYLATRSVPSLAAGGTDSATTSITIPADAVAGTYVVVVCADSGPGNGGRVSEIAETNENNNCLVSSNTITITTNTTLPDLVIASITNPPSTGSAGQLFLIQGSTANIGTGDATAFYNKYYLSPDGVTPLGAGLLIPGYPVNPIPAGGSQPISFFGTIPNNVPDGTYYLLACADAGPGTGGRTSEIVESNEANNCTASATTITIGQVDLLISSIGDPPTTGSVGTMFTINSVTSNIGGDNAGQSYNKYYLSTNGVTPRYLLADGAAVGPLAAGASVPLATAATVPTDALPGTYFLLGCADSGPGNGGRVSQLDESDESNNCKAAAGQIIVN